MSNVQCGDGTPSDPHLRYSNKLDISLPATLVLDPILRLQLATVRYLFIPRRISSRCTLGCNRYRNVLYRLWWCWWVSRYWSEVKSEWISDPGLLRVALSSLVCVYSSPISPPHIFVHCGTTYRDPNQSFVFAILFTFVFFPLSGNPEPRADGGTTYTLLIVILSALPPPISSSDYCLSNYIRGREENFVRNSCEKAAFHLVLSNTAPQALLWASCCGIAWYQHLVVRQQTTSGGAYQVRRCTLAGVGMAMEGFEGG